MIVGAFDLHRGQITFDYMDMELGEVRRGRIAPADRAHLREWLIRFEGQEAELAVEGCTGWRYVVEELVRVGVVPHLAEPADSAALRGRKKRAKTDRTDSTMLREALADGRLPESWIPPTQVLEVRAKLRLYKDLADERVGWIQRLHATLFHMGAPAIRAGLLTAEGQAAMECADLSPATRQAVRVGADVIEALSAQLDPLRGELVGFARRHPACTALRGLYGVGPLTSVAIWAEMGDCRRFSSSSDAVRHTGLDVTVWSSDKRRSAGRLSRQGPPVLRWALYEAAKNAARAGSPDHAYYHRTRERLGAKRATISVARKLARRAFHILTNLGDQALTEAA
jgi:transposase